MPKIVNTALKVKAKAWTFEAKAKATGPEAKAKAKVIKFGLEAPRGQGLASRTTSLICTHSLTPLEKDRSPVQLVGQVNYQSHYSQLSLKGYYVPLLV